MAKQLNVNLAFTADTGKAKAQIQELQNLLNKIAYTGATTNSASGIEQNIIKASEAAKELQFHLNNAFNATTGKFDLSLLDKSLKSSKSNITDLSTQLLSAGETGQQAFLKLAQSISLADQPMLRISNKMREFGTVMKNTIRWQLSSSMIHGFMGALQSAYGYAQDLNKSLTDIRIVTGANADEMARFAEQANKAAKNLSTTTTDYTKASLIYFQQGLSDQEVSERTNVTIKMANATGTSAEVVSDQMTAIWNNFDNGSKSLEYYADVMTALGAATASSTDEISQGLQKFAAVSETVGLSYEYATAALTTIMSNTRESADVVGTALKTLFARIQGLQLGETLEDGTTLNKYSEALNKVGISIYESNGELKAMDNILDEMAVKWDTMNSAEQAALAQTVAGVRQYTQLIALMENWNNGDSDSFKANLRTIEGAEGTLDKQAEIYAQSWEAAEKRVKAAAEGIYQSLLNDDFFISLNNGFANVLNGIDAFIDGLGGVGPLITSIASIFISNFVHKIPQVLDDLKYNLQILTPGGAEKAYSNIQDQMRQATQKAFEIKGGISKDSAMGYAIEQANKLTEARTKLALVSDKMSASEKQMYETSLGIISQTQEEVIALKQKGEALQKNIGLSMKSVQSQTGYFKSYDIGETQGNKIERNLDIDALGLNDNIDISNIGGDITATLTQKLMEVVDNYKTKINEITVKGLKPILGAEFTSTFDQIKEKINSVDQSNFQNVKKEFLNFIKILPDGVRDCKGIQEALSKISKANGPKELQMAFEKLNTELEEVGLNADEIEKILSSIHGEKINTLFHNMREFSKSTEEAEKKTNALDRMLKEFQPNHVVRMSEAFGALGGMLGNTVTLLTSFSSIVKTLDNPDLSGWEKFSSILMGISMIIPTITSAMASFATLRAFQAKLIEQENIALTKQAILQSLNTAAASDAYKSRVKDIQKVLVVMSAENKEKMASILADGALAASTDKLTKEKKEELTAQLASIIAGEKEVNTEHKEIAAKILEAHANKAVETTLWGIAKARLAAMPLSAKVILGIVMAIAAAVAIFSALHTSQKEANEAIDEANKKYDEEKQKLDDLNNSLKTTQERIDELNKKDSLSIIEQEELDKLKQEEILLQRQIALQKQLADAAQEKRIEETEKNFKKSSKLTAEGDVVKNTGNFQFQYVQGSEIPIFARKAETLEEYKTRVGYSDDISEAERLNWIENNEEAYQKIAAWEEEIQENHNQWLQDNAEQIQANEENYKNYIQDLNEQKINREDKKNYIEEQKAILKEQREKVYGEDYDEAILSPLVSQIENLNNIDFSIGDKIDWADIIGIKDLDLVGVTEDEFENYMDNAIGRISDKAAELGKDINKEFSELDSKEFELLLKNLDQLEHWDGSILLKDFINGLDDGGEGLTNKLTAIQQIKNELNEILGITSDLKIGDILSEEGYQLLLKYNSELEKYFILTGKGYKYLGGADTNFGVDEKIQEMQKQNDFYDAFDHWVYADGEKKGQQFDWGSYEGSSEGLRNMATADVDWKMVGEDYSSDKLIEIANMMDDETTAEEGKRQAEIFMKAFNEAMAVGQASDVSVQNELKYSSANNLNNLSEIHDQIGDNEAYVKGLQSIATEYESCEIELSEFQEVLKNNTEGMEEYYEALEKGNFDKLSDNAKKYEKALFNLNRAIKKAEWDKFTDGALDAAKALKKATSAKEVEKNLKKIQKAFKDDMGFDVSMDALEKYKDKFIEWADAGEESSDDVATQLYSLLQLEENVAEGFADFTDKEITLEVGADTYAAESKFSNLQDFYSSVKSIVEANPPVVDAYGNADFSNMIAAMLEAGYTAADVAAALQSIGQTEVDFSAWGSGLPNVNFGDIDSIINFINALNSWKGDIAGNTNAPITAEAIKNTFGGSLPAATGSGGGRHPGGGSGGGGGGGSKKHAEKKSDSERTRYHTLENQLEDLSAEYDEISEAADRAFGQEKLDNIDAQIKKTDELIDKQEEYLDAISQNLPIDKNVMTAYYDDVIGGPAMQFDENGNISNYDAIEEAMFNKYNSMADRYTDDSEEWQVFEKKYEQLEKYIEQYEETYDLLRDEEAAYQELLNQRADLELEKVQYKIELELDVPESEIAKLEYQIGRIEDDAYESAEAVQLLTKQAEAVYDQIQVNKQGLNDVIKLSQSFNNGTLTEEQADLIKEYRDNLLDLNEEFDDIRATIEEKVMETFDSFNEKLQTSVDVFDHYNSVLESYKNIVDIVGEDRLGISDQFMNGLNQASIDNAIEQLKATDTAMKAIQDAQAQAEVALAEAKARGDEASQRMWEETLSSLNEEAQSAQEEMLSAWENALDAIAETFEATVERVVKTFNDSIYALGGLEGLQDDFSRQQENADIMLDDYQKIYELSKLSRDINKTIDDTDVIGGKQKLKKLLGEINKLQEDGIEMSQYDLEYLQKTYDLRLAELELEEAQRAKNTVRLSRDNEGNWSYVYTQNTDAVDAAQQKYEDALYAMQDLSSNYIDEMSEQLISTSQEMAEALAAIRIQDYANIEDYYAEVERVQSQYQEELAMQEEELQKAIDNNKVLYDTDWTNYHNATGYKISDTELFATTFKDTLLGALIGSEEDSANFTDIMGAAVSDLTNNLMAGAEIYYTNLENAMNAAGTSTGDFAEDTAANIDAVVEKSKEGASAVDQMAIEMQTAMENIMDSVTNWQEAYGMAMENIIQSNLEVIESFNQMLAALSIDADSITVKYDIADAAGNKAQQFDTGGYTGEWGKGGKLAVLHEKELILNPGDTSNFLTAVQITRAMLETIDLNAKQASFGLGNLVPSTIKDDNTQTLEQQVHIIAEFPNVNDHNEIEQAFSNLINTASQYANRK